jgi:hypothetical protein
MLRTFAHLEQSTDLQDQGAIEGMQAVIARSEGDHAGALRHSVKAMEAEPIFGMGQDFVRQALVEVLDAAMSLREFEIAEGWIDRVKAMREIEVPTYVRGEISRFEGRLAAARDGDNAASKFGQAVATFRDLGTPFQLACTSTEWAEWLIGKGRREEAQPLLEEAATIFEKLGAAPWAERVERAAASS